MTDHPKGFPKTGLEDSTYAHVQSNIMHMEGFFSPFSPPPVWCIVKKHIFSLPSLSSCENIFSVKHLLEECGDRAGLLPVSKAAEWYAPPPPGHPRLCWLLPTVASQTCHIHLPASLYPQIDLCVNYVPDSSLNQYECAWLQTGIYRYIISFYLMGEAGKSPIKHVLCWTTSQSLVTMLSMLLYYKEPN